MYVSGRLCRVARLVAEVLRWRGRPGASWLTGVPADSAAQFSNFGGGKQWRGCRRASACARRCCPTRRSNFCRLAGVYALLLGPIWFTCRWNVESSTHTEACGPVAQLRFRHGLHLLRQRPECSQERFGAHGKQKIYIECSGLPAGDQASWGRQAAPGGTPGQHPAGHSPVLALCGPTSGL